MTWKVKIAAIAVIGLAGIYLVGATLRAQLLAPVAQVAVTRSVWDGVYTKEQAKRGETTYRQHCIACHGPTLTAGDPVPPLAGPRFIENWNGLTLGDLSERIRLTMPVGDEGKLTSQQSADVVAYMLSCNKFPVGKTELPWQAKSLMLIKIEPKAALKN